MDAPKQIGWHVYRKADVLKTRTGYRCIVIIRPDPVFHEDDPDVGRIFKTLVEAEDEAARLMLKLKLL